MSPCASPIAIDVHRFKLVKVCPKRPISYILRIKNSLVVGEVTVARLSPACDIVGKEECIAQNLCVRIPQSSEKRRWQDYPLLVI